MYNPIYISLLSAVYIFNTAQLSGGYLALQDVANAPASMLLSAHKSLKVSAYIHITQSKHLLNIKGNLRPGSLCDLPTNSVAHLCLIVCEIEMIFCRADCSLIFCRALQWSLQRGADVALMRVFELVIDPRWTRCKFPVWWYRPICHVWVQSTSTLYLPRCHVAGSCVVAITQITLQPQYVSTYSAKQVLYQNDDVYQWCPPKSPPQDR